MKRVTLVKLLVNNQDEALDFYTKKTGDATTLAVITHTRPQKEEDMLDTGPLRDAYRSLLDAAATVADSDDTSPVPPTGEWNADQILAHVAIVNAATITAASCVASGANTTFDSRIALDTWTIERVIALAGGNAGLRERIRLQGGALCALGG